MLKTHIFAIIAVVILLVVAALARVTTIPRKDKNEWSKSTSPAAQAGFGANGVVLDDNGKPIKNVKVYALWEDLDTHRGWCIRDTAISDKNGQFAFKLLPWLVREREYILIGYTPGRFLGETWTRIYRNVGSRNRRTVDADLAIQLHRLGSYSGRVVDQRGSGLGQVTVQPIAMIARDQSFTTEILKCIMKAPATVTDSHGNYKLVGVPVGFRLVVKTAKSGYCQYPLPYEAYPDRIVMIASARIRAKLVDQNGKGIAGADVNADAVGFDWYGRTTTDRNGEYVFDLYPAGRYAISAPEINGLIAKGLRSVRVEPGKTVEAPQMVAMRSVPLRGQVLDLSKLDESRSYVNLRPESYYSPITKSSLVDERNMYEHRVLPGETYQVEYRGLGLYKRNEARTVKVSKAGAARVDLRLQKVPTAVGYITDQFGLPVENTHVSLPGYGPVAAVGPFYGAATTGPDGKFEIGISPILAARTSGSIKVYAYNSERHLAAIESVDVNTLFANGLKLSLKPVSTLRVTVLGNGNKPVPGTTVYIAPEFPGCGSIETDSKGMAVFDVYPGIRYNLTAESHFGKKRYPEKGEMPPVADKGWQSEVRIKLH